MLNKKQLVILTTAVLVIGLVFIKQVSAQWENPNNLPGQGSINPPLTNPLNTDLNLNSNDITNVGTITSDQVCLSGSTCETAWPGGDVTNPMTAHLDAGNYRIYGITSPTTPKDGSTYYGLSAYAGNNSDNAFDTITVGLYGYTDVSSLGTSYGVYGLSQHVKGTGVYGVATKGWAGYFAGPWGSSGDGQISGGDLDILYDAGPKTGGNLYVEKKITSAQYCIGASCIVAWPSGVGGSGSTNYIPRFTAASTLGNSVIYQSSSKIGIGTTAPNKKLHVYDVSANAEIDIQSTAAASSWWGIYHNATSDDLVLWKDAADRFTFTDDGKFGVGVVPSVSIQTGGDITATGNVTAAAFLYSSDARLKTNVKTINNPLETIKSLRGVTFNWGKNNQPSLGFIAQEVEKVLPQLVHEQEGQKYLEYGNMTAVLVEAVKAQQQQIEELQAEIEQLKK